MPAYQHIVCSEPQTDVVVATFRSKKMFDGELIADLGEELISLVEKPRIVLDFTAVEAMASAVLNKLLLLQAELTPRGGRLALCGLNDVLMQIFTITKLNKKFKIYADQQAALASV